MPLPASVVRPRQGLVPQESPDPGRRVADQTCIKMHRLSSLRSLKDQHHSLSQGLLTIRIPGRPWFTSEEFAEETA